MYIYDIRSLRVKIPLLAQGGIFIAKFLLVSEKEPFAKLDGINTFGHTGHNLICGALFVLCDVKGTV
jgi:hypothetical protein